MTNYVYLGVSLDGYIAKTDDDIEWLFSEPNPDQSDYGYSEFIDDIDAIIMGRKSFQKVRTFDTWPYQKKVFVLTTTLSKIPEELDGKIEFISGTVREVTDHAKAQGYENLYIDGGITIQNFLREDMIDELILTRIPIVLGDGIPLFSTMDQSLRFMHYDTKVYDNALVKSHYSRLRV